LSVPAPVEVLKRFGTDPETPERLAADAVKAEAVLGIHGVSATARETTAPARRATRGVIESEFVVRDTPSRRDKLHRTIELPKPVTQEVADVFNRLFGRGGP
jgi:hypothetical protein